MLFMLFCPETKVSTSPFFLTLPFTKQCCGEFGTLKLALVPNTSFRLQDMCMQEVNIQIFKEDINYFILEICGSLKLWSKENNYIKNSSFCVMNNRNLVDNTLVWLLTYAQQRRTLLMNISHWQTVHHKDIHTLWPCNITLGILF